MTLLETPSGLAKPSTETLLRVSVLVFWFMLGVQIFIAPIPQTDGTVASPPPLLALIGTGAQFLGFGLAFWFNTRNIAHQSAGLRPLLLLAYQALCGFTLSTDLLYIVAAEIPLVLPGRIAMTWIIVQTLFLTGWIFILDMIGAPLQFMQIPQLPHFWVILLTDIGVFGTHAFAFFMGYLAASEARGRKAAERLNAELLATQDLLAQSSRIAERAFVARELHDVLGHHLVALKVNLELAQHLMQDPKNPLLQDAQDLVGELLSEVRAVVGRVRGMPKIELRQAMETLIAGVTELSIKLVFPADLEITDPALAHALFRCVQEAITNAIKHAKAQTLWIEFGNYAHDITLVVHDNGKGAAQLTLGNGLKGMRERLETLGGTLAIAHSPEQGFTLSAHIPKQAGPQP